MRGCALSGLAGTVIMRVNAPIVPNAPGRLFVAKTGKIRCKRPLSLQKREERPGHTAVNAPLSFLGINARGPGWQRHLSVGDGDVFEAGKGMLYM